MIGQRILRIAGEDPNRLLLVIMLAVALLSGFMSDAGTVAVLLPAIISVSASAQISPSRLLIPLSFGSLLGGAMTLIGTPPNIIVTDLLKTEGLTPFGFFDFTPIGLALLISGTAFMFLLGRHLLPEHKPKQDVQRVENPEELVDLYRLPDNLFRMRVRRGSEITGLSLQQAGLRSEYNLTVLGIQRPSETREVARLGERSLVLQDSSPQNIAPTADAELMAGDILVVQGDGSDVSHASARLNLAVQPARTKDEHALVTNEVGVAEVLLPPRSSLVGKTIVETRFGSVYQLTVLGIQRASVDEPLPLKTTKLKFGDILLVQGPWKNIQELRAHPRDFVVMGQPEQMVPAQAWKRAPLALAILVGMLVVLVTNLLPVAVAAMLAGLLMILTGCVSIDEAYEAVDWKSIVLIAGMLPMATALERVGLVGLAADWMTSSFGEMSPLFIIGSLFLVTSLFTQVLSNTATAVLIAPIALAAATNLGLRPYAFLMAVAIAASMAFASPVASPVNTLVMGAGNYSFKDFMKVGLPMILLMMVVSLLLLPVLWPLK